MVKRVVLICHNDGPKDHRVAQGRAQQGRLGALHEAAQDAGFVAFLENHFGDAVAATLQG